MATLSSYLRSRYSAWRSVFPEFRETLSQFRRWGEFTGRERAFLVFYAIVYFWEIVIPCVLVPAVIVFFVWVIVFVR
jgi:hypothetical protein